MNITYRELTEQELDLFIEMRIAQLREEGAKEEIDLVPALKDYYHRHMADDTFVSWIALDNGTIIGWIYQKRPFYAIQAISSRLADIGTGTFFRMARGG